MSQAVAGDFQITVRMLTRPTGVHENSQAGLMVRESLDPSARHALLCPDFSLLDVELKWRSVANESSDSEPVLPPEALQFPITLRLTRRGQTLSAELSRDDGKSFQPAGAPLTFDEPLPATVYAGLAISAHNPQKITEAKFSGLEIRKR